MAEEPILWVRSGYQPPVTPTGEYHPETGEPIVERLPVTAPPPADHPLAGKSVKRWDRWVDSAGNVIAFVYTGGAADYDVHATNGGARKSRLRRQIGWFQWGECPLALVQAGTLHPRFLGKELRGQPACAERTYSESRPCLHARAEAARRKEVNAKVQAARTARFEDESKTILKAAQTAQQQAAQAQEVAAQQQTAILDRLAKVLEQAVGGGLLKKANMAPNAPDDPETGHAVMIDTPVEPEPTVSLTEVAAGEAIDKDAELARLMDEADAELAGEAGSLVERAGVAPPVPIQETIEDAGPPTSPTGRGRRR